MRPPSNRARHSIIVYGPAGCGLTSSIGALQAKLRLRYVLDDWDKELVPLPWNTLILTHDVPPFACGLTAMTLKEAMTDRAKRGTKP